MILWLAGLAIVALVVFFMMSTNKNNKVHQKRLEEIQKRLKEKENEKL
jgi:hypothetical protein